MRWRALAFGCAAMLAAASTSIVARADVGAVSIRDNYFDPATINVTVDGSVVWTHAGTTAHTVQADDGSFSSPTLSTGSSYTTTFAGDATIRYRCSIHPGMRGVVVVGNGGTEPPDPEPAPVIRVPLDQPTIQKAIDVAAEGTIVLVDPGTYREAIGVGLNGVQIVGNGAGVVIDGRDVQGRRVRTIGIQVQASDVRIAGVTIRDFNEAGIRVEQAKRYTIEKVTTLATGAFGVVANGSQGGLITGVDASGVGEGAIAITGCSDCDALVEHSHVHTSGIGIELANAGGVVVRDNIAENNAVGIAALTLATTPETAPQSGVHILRNDIHDNNFRSVPTYGLSANVQLPWGIGVWLAGALHNSVRGNVIEDNGRYGVVVSQLGVPSFDDRIVANVVRGSGRADLAWDGAGVNVCFSGNAAGEGVEPSSSPPVAQVLYSCALPATVGVPNPSIAAQLGLSLLQRYWCVADRATCDTAVATIP